MPTEKQLKIHFWLTLVTLATSIGTLVWGAAVMWADQRQLRHDQELIQAKVGAMEERGSKGLNIHESKDDERVRQIIDVLSELKAKDSVIIADQNKLHSLNSESITRIAVLEALQRTVDAKLDNILTRLQKP